MIDPKLNEIPVEGKIAVDTSRPETETAETLRRGRTGLSITDTVAGDTLLSSGSRGVDTSGVSAGAGVGAGSSALTPGTVSESPAPSQVAGGRGSGTTVRGGVDTAVLADSPSTETTYTDIYQEGEATRLNTLDVAHRAYQIWCSKGCPEGTADQDWLQAERELQAESRGTLARAATL